MPIARSSPPASRLGSTRSIANRMARVSGLLLLLLVTAMPTSRQRRCHACYARPLRPVSRRCAELPRRDLRGAVGISAADLGSLSSARAGLRRGQWWCSFMGAPGAVGPPVTEGHSGLSSGAGLRGGTQLCRCECELPVFRGGEVSGGRAGCGAGDSLVAGARRQLRYRYRQVRCLGIFGRWPDCRRVRHCVRGARVRAGGPPGDEAVALRLRPGCDRLVRLVDLESDGKDLGKSDVPDYIEAYLGCKLSQCPAGWARSASPFPYIDAKDPPFLIQHGAADTSPSAPGSVEAIVRSATRRWSTCGARDLSGRRTRLLESTRGWPGRCHQQAGDGQGV